MASPAAAGGTCGDCSDGIQCLAKTIHTAGALSTVHPEDIMYFWGQGSLSD